MFGSLPTDWGLSSGKGFLCLPNCFPLNSITGFPLRPFTFCHHAWNLHSFPSSQSLLPSGNNPFPPKLSLLVSPRLTLYLEVPPLNEEFMAHSLPYHSLSPCSIIHNLHIHRWPKFHKPNIFYNDCNLTHFLLMRGQKRLWIEHPMNVVMGQWENVGWPNNAMVSLVRFLRLQSHLLWISKFPFFDT